MKRINVEAEDIGSQTDPKFYNHAFTFRIDDGDIEWRQRDAAAQYHWLETWQPPLEWMQ